MTWQPVDEKTPHDRPIMVKGGLVLVMFDIYYDPKPHEGMAIVCWKPYDQILPHGRGWWLIPQTPVQIIDPQFWMEIPDDRP